MPAHVQVWWSSLLAADAALLDALDPVERARVQSLERPADQGRSLVAAALLRTAVGTCLGAPPATVVIDRTCEDCGRTHGRPRVLGPGDELPHVSVSHSGVLVVVALAVHVPVGVDVQRIADVPSEGRSAASAAEQWVRDEALAKLGRGEAPSAVRLLTPPDQGYAAALAVRADRAPHDADLEIHHWPGPTVG